jgi:hypothetical protein
VRALRFLLYFILVINTGNSTTYNIFDLITHINKSGSPLIKDWGKVTDMLYEIFMTLNGMAFLIIFKLIANMKMANNTARIVSSENLFVREGTLLDSYFQSNKLYGS